MDEIKEWIKKAKRDFEATKVNFREGFCDISAFLLQQIKTHDLGFLAKNLKLPKKFLHPCEEMS